MDWKILREKEPFFMQRTHVLLNIIYIQADPPPKGGAFTDPLSGTLDFRVERLRSFNVFMDDYQGCDLASRE
jgi:hypothetical protein